MVMFLITYPNESFKNICKLVLAKDSLLIFSFVVLCSNLRQPLVPGEYSFCKLFLNAYEMSCKHFDTDRKPYTFNGAFQSTLLPSGKIFLQFLPR